MEDAKISFSDERSYEIIDGIVCMSPSPNIRHNKIMGNIYTRINAYLKGRKCSVHMVANVHLDAERPSDYVIPDVSVFCEPDKLKTNGYHGVPELLVEILSYNKDADRKRKFKLYERVGVKEYWIVEPLANTVEQYVITDGKYELRQTYGMPNEEEIEFLLAEDLAKFVTVIKPTIFEDCELNLAEIFE